MHQSQPREQGQMEVSHCYWHPGVETGLYCSQCGKHVCTQCMVQAPVGIRCRECGKAVRMPTFDIQPTYYARAVSAAVAPAIAGGLLWALLTYIVGGIPLVPSLGAIGVGYGVGEIISWSVNRKRGIGLAWIAGCAVLVAFLISWAVNPFGFGVFPLLLLGFGVYIAVQRVR